MMSLLKSTAIVLLLSAAYCTKGELIVLARPDVAGKQGKAVGTLSYEWRGSHSTVDVSITDNEYYSTILKDSGKTYFFEFKAKDAKRATLRSAIKYEPV